MPYTKKFLKIRTAMRKEYGKKQGTRIAFTTAKKRGWRI